MVDYAVRTVRYCNNHPARGSTYAGGYVDFANIGSSNPDAGDCTNFISHCLLAGGAVTRDGQNGEQNCWFFKNINNRSSSWAGVTQLYDFLTWNTVRGPAGHYVEWHFTNRVEMAYTTGDIIQVWYNGKNDYTHSLIITDMNGGISGPCKISVSSRSNATSYNVDVDIETTNYISQTLRVIALDGYYV